MTIGRYSALVQRIPDRLWTLQVMLLCVCQTGLIPRLEDKNYLAGGYLIRSSPLMHTHVHRAAIMCLYAVHYGIVRLFPGVNLLVMMRRPQRRATQVPKWAPSKSPAHILQTSSPPLSHFLCMRTLHKPALPSMIVRLQALRRDTVTGNPQDRECSGRQNTSMPFRI